MFNLTGCILRTYITYMRVRLTGVTRYLIEMTSLTTVSNWDGWVLFLHVTFGLTVFFLSVGGFVAYKYTLWV